MSWLLTDKDLYLLVKMLDGGTLIGLSNPFPKWTEEQLNPVRKKTFQKLHNLDLVDFADGELRFEENFIQALWIMARTNMVTDILLESGSQSLFYFGGDRVVECVQINDTEYEIHVHGPPAHAWQQIIIPRMLMGIENITIQSNESIMILPHDFTHYIEAGKIDNIDLLAKNNGQTTAKLLEQLNRSIQRKNHTQRLMIFYKHSGKWNIEGVHILSSSSFNWTLRMVQDEGIEWLEAKQATGMQIVKELTGVIERVKEPQYG